VFAASRIDSMDVRPLTDDIRLTVVHDLATATAWSAYYSVKEPRRVLDEVLHSLDKNRDIAYRLLATLDSEVVGIGHAAETRVDPSRRTYVFVRSRHERAQDICARMWEHMSGWMRERGRTLCTAWVTDHFDAGPDADEVFWRSVGFVDVARERTSERRVTATD